MKLHGEPTAHSAGARHFDMFVRPPRRRGEGVGRSRGEGVRCLHAELACLVAGGDQNSLIDTLSPDEAACAAVRLAFWARPNQLPPKGGWRVWLLLAGRGFGKTRTGAELVRARVAARTARRLALVAPTAADARNVMVEGESGILAISPQWDRPRYEPSKRRLTWPQRSDRDLLQRGRA